MQVELRSLIADSKLTGITLLWQQVLSVGHSLPSRGCSFLFIQLSKPPYPHAPDEKIEVYGDKGTYPRYVPGNAGLEV